MNGIKNIEFLRTFYCQHVLPLVYDESLSYYEQLCKIKAKVNEVIASQNELAENFKNLTKWIDEQLELYAKGQLQEWLDNGTLENIINEQIFGKLNASVKLLDKRFKIIEPSGDETGSTDIVNINNALNDYFNVYLTRGDFYINNSIVMGLGRHLIGSGNVSNTIINVVRDVSCVIGSESTHDHISIEDIQFNYIGIEKSTNPCLKFDDSINEPYNGARYSYFKNLYIIGFNIGAYCKGMWSTVFDRIRTLQCETGVKLGSVCNNITFRECEFTHGTNGADLTAYDGRILLNNIRFDNTNFEGMAICVSAIGVVNLSMIDCYTENSDQVVKFNSCPSAHINGGSFFNISSFGTFENTAFPKDVKTYNNPNYSVENIYIRVNIEEDKILTYSNQRIYTNNINLINQLNGNVKFGSPANISGVSVNSNFNLSSSKLEKVFIPFQNVSQTKKYYLGDIVLTITNESITTSTSTSILIRNKNLNEIVRISLPAREYIKGNTLYINLDYELTYDDYISFMLNQDSGTDLMNVNVNFNVITL